MMRFRSQTLMRSGTYELRIGGNLSASATSKSEFSTKAARWERQSTPGLGPMFPRFYGRIPNHSKTAAERLPIPLKQAEALCFGLVPCLRCST